MINRKWGWPLIVVNVLAFLDSIYLTWHHYKIEIAKPVTSSFCSINSFIDCDSVALSPYSRFLGLPTASLGVFAYAFLLIIFSYFFFKRGEKSKKHFNLMFIVLLIMLLFSIKQFIASLLFVKAICIMCVGLYLCILLMTLFCLLLLGRPSFKEGLCELVDLVKIKSMNNTSFYFITFIISVVISLGVSGVSQYHFGKNLEVKVKKDEVISEPQTPLEIFNSIKEENIDYTGLPFKGAEDAPFVFLEASDFECPFCSSRGRDLLKLIERFDGLVKVYFLHYPLDQNCNPSIKRKFHENACLAAKYAICAKEQNKFWKYHDYLFENQKRINSSLLKKSISGFSFNIPRFNECLSKRASVILKKNLELAKKIDVTYTPTIYLNGKKVSSKLPRQDQIIALMEQIMKESLEQ